MACLVLHLGEEDCLALKCGRAGDPVAFGQLADDFGVRMLADLADQRFAVARWHPVFWFDLDILVDAVLKGRLFGGHFLAGFDALAR